MTLAGGAGAAAAAAAAAAREQHPDMELAPLLTTGHVVALIIFGLIVLGLMALRHLAKATAADTLDIEGAPEVELDRRHTTTIRKGNRTLIL